MSRKQSKEDNMVNTKIFALILVAIVVSFIGFCVENVFISFTHGFMNNRNMVLPFLFGYGLAILVYYALFGTPNKPFFFGKEIAFATMGQSMLYCFIISMIGVSIGEIILGHMTEWCCDIIWWDYSIIPLHITRYTSIPTSAGFAFMITVFMRFCFDPLLEFFQKMHPNALSFIACTFALVLVLDMINSTLYMFKNNNTLQIWRIDFPKPLKDYILAIGHKI